MVIICVTEQEILPENLFLKLGKFQGDPNFGKLHTEVTRCMYNPNLVALSEMVKVAWPAHGWLEGCGN